MSGEIWSEITSRPAEKAAADPAVSRVDTTASPRKMRSVAITGIFVLAIFYTLYFTAEIAIPLVFALLFKLLLQPGVRVLGRLKVPQPLGALAMIILLFAVLGGGGFLLGGPATAWLERAPQSLPRLEQHLRVFEQPIQQVQEATKQVEKLTQPQAPGEMAPVTVKGPGLVDYLFSGTRRLMSGLGITVLMLFFLLSSGELFMRRLVEILPNFRDKKRAVEMSHEVEENISAYLLTISIMNALVGIAAGLAMWAIGIPDPILWGALAFVLNYVLILGPLTGMALFFVAGLMSFDTLWQALIPPGAYLIIHMIEGEWVTPMLVAKRFTLNPVLVIGSLIFWDWMWGIPGALLAVPMLAVFKIVCDRVQPLAALGHFIEG
ncbi:MAG TPA: AI-2E family transporter [Stellaceae bacterium]|nr:AI-2E family transporter [Stellaceae bacterium]